MQINAGLAAVVLLLFFFTPHKWIIFVLSVDFFVRGFLNPAYSLFSAISRTMLNAFDIKPLMINAGPKIFAARIGFLFCCMIAGTYWANMHTISLFIVCVFAFCAVLEAVFKFCLACKIYPFIIKLKRPDW